MDGRNAGDDWWRHAVVYQIYPRSFADANGDGVGDIAGMRARCRTWPRSASTRSGSARGTPRRWPTAAMTSPTTATSTRCSARWPRRTRCIDEAHAVGIRVIIDIVPNHTSDQHPWFQEALAAAPGSAERDRFIFRDGRGAAGELPPNDWRSAFGGPAWTAPRRPDGQWYLHLFAPEQPDLNWAQRRGQGRVRATSCGSGSTAAWTGSGSTSAHGLAKDRALPDRTAGVPPRQEAEQTTRTGTARACTTSTAAGAPSLTHTRRPGCSSPRLGRRRAPAGCSTSARTSCTPPSTSTS